MSTQQKVVSRTFACLIDPKGWYDCHQDPIRDRIRELGFNIKEENGYSITQAAIVEHLKNYHLPVNFIPKQFTEHFDKQTHKYLLIEKEGPGIAEEFAAAIKADGFFTKERTLFFPENQEYADAFLEAFIPHWSLRIIEKFDKLFPNCKDATPDHKLYFRDVIRVCEEISKKTKILGGFVENFDVSASNYKRIPYEKLVIGFLEWSGHGIVIDIIASADYSETRFDVLIHVDLDKPKPTGEVRKCIHYRTGLKHITSKHMAQIKLKITEHFNRNVVKKDLTPA